MFDKSLEIIGNEGWELINTRRVISIIRGTATECIFKRQGGLLKLGKSAKDTKIIVVSLELSFLEKLKAIEDKGKLAKEKENTKRMQAILEKYKKMEKEKKEQVALEERLTIKKNDTNNYIKTELVKTYEEGIFYYAKFKFQNISDSQIDKIVTTCFVMDGSRMVRKKKVSILDHDKILSPNNTKMFEYPFFNLKQDEIKDLKFHVILEKIRLVESKVVGIN